MSEPEIPTQPCSICKGTRFWLRATNYGRPEYLCSVCHPCPIPGVKTVDIKGDKIT